MTVEYNSSRSEVAAWYWFNWKHNPRLRWAQVRIFAGVVLVMLFLRLRLAPLASHDVVVACLWGLGVLACLSLYPQLKFKPQRRGPFLFEQRNSPLNGGGPGGISFVGGGFFFPPPDRGSPPG